MNGCGKSMLVLALACPVVLAGPQTKMPVAEDAVQAAADAVAETMPPPKSHRWLKVYEDSKFTISFDTETASKESSNVTFWERWKFKQSHRSVFGRPYVEKIVRATYYCGSRQWSADLATWRNLAGEVVSRMELKSWEIERENVVPDTVGEAKYEAACNE